MHCHCGKNVPSIHIGPFGFCPLCAPDLQQYLLTSSPAMAVGQDPLSTAVPVLNPRTMQPVGALHPIGLPRAVTYPECDRLMGKVPPGPLKVVGEDGSYDVVDCLGSVVAECSDRGYAELFASAPGMAMGLKTVAWHVGEVSDGAQAEAMRHTWELINDYLDSPGLTLGEFRAWARKFRG